MRALLLEGKTLTHDASRVRRRTGTAISFNHRKGLAWKKSEYADTSTWRDAVTETGMASCRTT